MRINILSAVTQGKTVENQQTSVKHWLLDEHDLAELERPVTQTNDSQYARNSRRLHSGALSPACPSRVLQSGKEELLFFEISKSQHCYYSV